MKKLLVAFVLMASLGAFAAADANIPWQFTGATNRVAAAESVPVATDYVRPLPLWLPIAYFDTLMPLGQRFDGCNLDSTSAGLIFLFR